VDCTKRNAVRNNLKVEALRSDLFEKVDGYFDVIVFNPPYLPEETRSTSWIEKSWSGGNEGSEVAVRFIEEAWRHLAPGGRVYIILSSLGGFMTALKAAKEHYNSEMLEEKHMFFESIYAYRLVPRTYNP
jgi:release factor glutamine methyltransferase